MASEFTKTTERSAWQTKEVYGMAAVCLLLGLAIGYLFRGSQSPAAPPQTNATIRSSAPAPSAAPAQTSAPVPPSAPAGASSAPMRGKMPTLDDMKNMADTKAQPLLAKLKTDPKNAALLIQVGGIYESTHQFKDAAGYYNKALQVTPKNVGVRTEMASCLYYSGDVDGAIGQLQQSLRYDPKNANSLFNLGMMKLQGKQDSQGALAAWRELLKSNPGLDTNHKATVEKLIAEVEKKAKS
ncbi:MAG: tetratricopeptide repeat protein [Candidatus Sulfotelmatobacter sp.]